MRIGVLTDHKRDHGHCYDPQHGHVTPWQQRGTSHDGRGVDAGQATVHERDPWWPQRNKSPVRPLDNKVEVQWFKFKSSKQQHIRTYQLRRSRGGRTRTGHNTCTGHCPAGQMYWGATMSQSQRLWSQQSHLAWHLTIKKKDVRHRCGSVMFTLWGLCSVSGWLVVVSYQNWLDCHQIWWEGETLANEQTNYLGPTTRKRGGSMRDEGSLFYERQCKDVINAAPSWEPKWLTHHCFMHM